MAEASCFTVLLAEPVADVQEWTTIDRGEIVIRTVDGSSVCFREYDMDAVRVARELAASLIAAADKLDAQLSHRTTAAEARS